MSIGPSPVVYSPPANSDKARKRVRKSEFLSRCALVAGSMLFALGVVELPALFNIVDYQALEFGGVWGNLRFIRVPDPELLHIEPPHAHYSGEAYGGDAETIYQIPPADRLLFRWNLRYDQHGFRNGTDLKSADTIVIGDSMVEGMTVSDTEVVTSVLQRLEGKTVANFGQYGYGPQQEMAVLKRYGLPLHPRTVIWMFSESTDLSDVIGYRRVMSHPPNFWNFFLQRSFSRFAYRAVKRLATARKIPGSKRSGVLPMPNGAGRTIYFTSPAHPLNASELDALGETIRIIASANELARGQGAHLLFVFVPEKFRVYSPFCQFPAESECSRWAVSDLPERMRRDMAAVSPEIGYLDLTPIFQKAAQQGALPYYSDDVHWSPEGHRVAGEAIYRALRTRELSVSVGAGPSN